MDAPAIRQFFDGPRARAAQQQAEPLAKPLSGDASSKTK
jgi:hypothetical protein